MNTPERIKVKDIARMTDVSVRTVDHVLHERSGVSEASRKRVGEILEKLNYRPNMYASAPASSKKYASACLLSQHETREYWTEVENGIHGTLTAYSGFNITVRLSYYDPYDYRLFTRVAHDVIEQRPDDALFAPTIPQYTTPFTNEPETLHISYIYTGSDIKETPAFSFFGQNSHQDEYFAARMLILLAGDAQGIVIFRKINEGIVGSNRQERREAGFHGYMQKYRPSCRIWRLDLHAKRGGEDEQMLDDFFQSHPTVKSDITFNSKACIIGEYLLKHQRTDFNPMGYDLLQHNVKCLEQGNIFFLVARQPTLQGFDGIKALCDHLILKKEIARRDFIPIDLLTKENIEYYYNKQKLLTKRQYMETKYLRISTTDNVAVAIVTLPAGGELVVDGKEIILGEDVPAGHKFALKDFTESENVIKYDYPIGHTHTVKKRGDWISKNDTQTDLAGLLEYIYSPTEVNLNIPHENLTFKGYHRKNGDVGVRNEIWITPTVGYVSGIVNQLAEGLRRKTEGKGVGAIVAFPHNYGCSQLGDDHENTKKTLRDMILHPSTGVMLVAGLGCESNQPDIFQEFLGDYNSDRVKFMMTQRVGGEYKEGMELPRELYAKASKDERVDVSLSELRVGLKCDDSDGFSSIAADPLLRMFSDFLITQDGTSVLTEVPGMFGAETVLMDRYRNKELFEETVKLISDFKEYFLSYGESAGENPSPGNKAGGISTLEDKALGCTQRYGESYMDGVLPYGKRSKVKGLDLLSAPGNDLVAATIPASYGYHMVLFATGCGTPFGAYIPAMKISTNSALTKNKPGWIDLNAGVILENEPMEKTHERFIDYAIRVTSGELVSNEKRRYEEIAIFKTGITL